MICGFFYGQVKPNPKERMERKFGIGFQQWQKKNWQLKQASLCEIKNSVSKASEAWPALLALSGSLFAG